MDARSHEAIQRDPDYKELVRRRSSFGWTLSAIMLVIYFGFILLVAYAPKFLGMRLGTGVTTIGIPIGLFVIVSAFVLTAIYVSKANSKYDALIRRIVEEVIAMKKLSCILATAIFASLPSLAFAAGAIDGGTKQAVNWVAIGMFVAFVALTLGITYWAAKQTASAADFYSAGGGITGFQNGLAIAGDYMSAASFLGISGLVYTSGYDGLIYSVGWLVGWPIVTFLIAEQLRNLGKFTFADVASFRLRADEIRILAACGSLVTVAFYLIAQMVGAGKLIQLLFGLDYWMAVVLVGGLMMIYVTFGGMKATTWVQIIKAVLLLMGATFMAVVVLYKFGFSPEALSLRKADPRCIPSTAAIMEPGSLISNPLSAISLGLALMFGTAGLPHILMRFFTVKDAQAARKSVLYATGFIGYFYILTFIIGFGAIVLVSTDAAFLDAGILEKTKSGSRRSRAAPTWQRSIWRTRSAATYSSASSRRWPSPPSWRWYPAWRSPAHHRSAMTSTPW